MIRSALTFVGLLLGCGGIGLFIALGTYVWALRDEVNRQAATLAERANGIGEQADEAIGFVREVIGQARMDLATARAQSVAAPPARPLNMMEQIIARRASQQLAGSVERAHGAVVTAADAVTVADAALEVFSGNTELRQLLGVQPEQMNATKSTLSRVASELRGVKTVLGLPVDDGSLTSEQLNAVSTALGQAQGFTDELETVVQNARTRVKDAQSSLNHWSWRLAISTSLICALAAIGQVFLVRYCWRTLRGSPA